MRPFAFLAAIPLALGCAQQSALRAPALPSDEPLQVRLHQPTGGALNYQLSEPAYIAVFAVTRGHGISMVYPHFQSQIDHRGHAGLNQETIHGGSGSWAFPAGARYDHRSLFGHADAYYIVASKYPLPVEGMLQSPYLLRSLVGADLFRAANLESTWAAIESILVAGLPDDTWSSDVYLNWRDPFMVASWPFRQHMGDCGGRGFLAGSPFRTADGCTGDRTTVYTSPPVGQPPVGQPPVGQPPVSHPPKIVPPKDPLDRRPHGPLEPPRLGPAGAVAHTSRRMSESLIGMSRRNAEPGRAEAIRPSDGGRAKAPGITERANAVSRQAPAAPLHAAESRPQQVPARPESRPSEAHPDN